MKIKPFTYEEWEKQCLKKESTQARKKRLGYEEYSKYMRRAYNLYVYRLEVGNVVWEYEHDSMPQEEFNKEVERLHKMRQEVFNEKQ